MSEFVIYGAGGHARVVKDLIQRNGSEVVCFFEDQIDSDRLQETPVVAYQPDRYPDALLILAIGSGTVRKRLSADVTHRFATLIHPDAVIGENVQIGAGSVVLAGSVIQAGAHIGQHVIVNANAVIDHDAVVGDYVHVGPGVYIGAGAVVAEGTVMNPNSVLMRFTETKAWFEVGAGVILNKEA